MSISTLGFDHVLPLAVGIGRPAFDIFEIDLPDGHGRGPLQGLMQTRTPLGDALMGFEQAINRATRGDGELEELQGGIPFERVANGFLTWDAA